jgi:hypothetical protein
MFQNPFAKAALLRRLFYLVTGCNKSIDLLLRRTLVRLIRCAAKGKINIL